MRHDIVLKNNALFFPAEEPVDCFGDAFGSAHIGVAEKGQYLARPIHLLNNPPRFAAESRVFGPRRAWPIGRHIQTGRPCFADCGKGCLRELGSVKE
ncbi:MAG: hypothetical protein LBC79_05485 [Deltaproteobacteria bacterium]|nr:hypothetical protein [Deltaproteobacteria bacterium]